MLEEQLSCVQCGMSLNPEDMKAGTCANCGALLASRPPTHQDPPHPPPPSGEPGTFVCTRCGFAYSSRVDRCERGCDGEVVHAEATPQAHEIVLSNPITRESVTIKLDVPAILGREGDACASFFSNPRISRRHVRVSWDGDGIWVEDLRSLNRTKVNGRCLNPYEKHPIRKGDSLRMADEEYSVEDFR